MTSKTKKVWVSIPVKDNRGETWIHHFYLKAPQGALNSDLKVVGQRLVRVGCKPHFMVHITPTVCEEFSLGVNPEFMKGAIKSTDHPTDVTELFGDEELFVATRIPNGFPQSREYFGGHLRNAGIDFSSSTWDGGDFVFVMDRANIDALNTLRETQPQIFGNPNPDPKPYAKLLEPEKPRGYRVGEVYCKKCGSMETEVAMWVYANTGVVKGDFGSFNEPDSSFCRSCESHGTLARRK